MPQMSPLVWAVCLCMFYIVLLLILLCLIVSLPPSRSKTTKSKVFPWSW